MQIAQCLVVEQDNSVNVELQIVGEWFDLDDGKRAEAKRTIAKTDSVGNWWQFGERQAAVVWILI